jgi:hypothetical protein
MPTFPTMRIILNYRTWEGSELSEKKGNRFGKDSLAAEVAEGNAGNELSTSKRMNHGDTKAQRRESVTVQRCPEFVKPETIRKAGID